MKKKILKYLAITGFAILVIITICNIYNWIVCGKQSIKINTSSKAYTNSDLYIAITAQKNGEELESKKKIKLTDSNGKKIKNVNVKYENDNAILSIPKVDSGNYYIEAKVSSKAGKDTVKKGIYIENSNEENITINLDKGIYKPGDTINYRVLLTNKYNDKPISEDVNVSFYDGNDNKVYNENVKSSEYGIISGKFTLADEVNSGTYRIVVKINNNETTKQFKVNPYVTPKYEINTTYDKKEYLVGDTAKININAKYFFGEVVPNADITVYINDEKYKTIKLDAQGNGQISYEIKEAKTYNVKIEAVDSSNYYVEESSSFVAGTDKFEVKLLPEYGSLISNKTNNIYVFTTKNDGTPLKTYVTVTSDNFTKQVATDENGIGKFSIDIGNTNNVYSNSSSEKSNSSTKKFSITAQKEDEKDNTVKKDFKLDMVKKDLLISTDKVKYEQGEDIKVSVSSTKEKTKNIYFFKNQKLIKMLSTDLEDTSINLEDTYGLIDIYVTEGTEKQSSNTNNKAQDFYNNYKRTIFIKPSKKLNINVSTDKNEYKPGENISISFNTTNENNSEVDSALLVSMLDNSVLNLANNDLSIDNIKMALNDIKFSDDLDAQTLYSCIVNDTSEQTMMALLLKQKDKNVNISESIINNKDREEKSAYRSIVLMILIIIIVLIYLCSKFGILKKVLMHVINFAIYGVILFALTTYTCDEILGISSNLWWIIGITVVISLATYIGIVYKLNKKVFKTSISIIITTVLALIYAILVDEMDISNLLIIYIIAVLALVLVIVQKIIKNKNINLYEKINKIILSTVKFIGAVILSLIIVTQLDKKYYLELELILPLLLIFIYIFNYLFNKKINLNDIKNIKKSKDIKIIIALVTIIIILVGMWSWIYKELSPTSKKNKNSQTDIGIDNGYTTAIPKRGLNPQNLIGLDTDSSSNESNVGNKIQNIWEDFTDSSQLSENSTENNTENQNEQQEEVVDKLNEKEENVRNIFLESMCFVPDLVTTQGKANLDLKLSDNITTWTIQTVGNTKDGEIGYNVLNNIKVFKEFFVDFELPKNLTQTDNVSIPVTVYNYTENEIETVLKVQEADWFSVTDKTVNVKIPAKASKMVYIPISILKTGNNKFRVEATSNELTDIIEKECEVSPKGYKVSKVALAGTINKKTSDDILVLDNALENTAKAKVKLYSTVMSQTVEGMEKIFKMPTGCFEQVSSSLYPNILALKYLEDNKLSDEKIKEKALSYISSGYQKLLTYEVKGESGGYSLYGKSPAETVLTAYGLMELTDLSQVYNVDDNVTNKMKEFLYKNQNSDGTFKISKMRYSTVARTGENLALNAYITWALSESDANDERLKSSVDYLKDKLDNVNDNYTLALIANTLANVKDKELNNVLKRLVNNIKIEDKIAYITSDISDYYGSAGNVQNIQTVALTSMALSKSKYKQDTNKLLINYLISQKDINGNWYSTQATILSLKALNINREKNEIQNQTIKVKLNSDEKTIDIKENALDLYELDFENLSKENKLDIELENGSLYYEVIEEYYVPYEDVDTKNDKMDVKVQCNNELKVNEILNANIKLVNNSKNLISNGMVKISIPQGFTVVEDSLMKLEKNGIIEKYEISYSEINIYLRNFDVSQIVDLNISFRAGYPVKVTGLDVKAYDYYNPEIEGKSLPLEIKVNN